MYEVPQDMVLMGTCGACGGPLLAPMHWMTNNTENQEPPIQCAFCQRIAKPSAPARFGPIKEML